MENVELYPVWSRAQFRSAYSFSYVAANYTAAFVHLFGTCLAGALAVAFRLLWLLLCRRVAPLFGGFDPRGSVVQSSEFCVSFPTVCMGFVPMVGLPLL